jgi:hypothetical protein
MRTDESAMAGEDLGVAGYGGALIWDDARGRRSVTILTGHRSW